jgi:hypothetical protein
MVVEGGGRKTKSEEKEEGEIEARYGKRKSAKRRQRSREGERTVLGYSKW